MPSKIDDAWCISQHTQFQINNTKQSASLPSQRHYIYIYIWKSVAERRRWWRIALNLFDEKKPSSHTATGWDWDGWWLWWMSNGWMSAFASLWCKDPLCVILVRLSGRRIYILMVRASCVTRLNDWMPSLLIVLLLIAHITSSHHK